MNRLFSTIIAVFMFLGMGIFPARVPTHANSKISEEVREVIDSLEQDDELPVYVIITDIDHDTVMERFSNTNPEQYREYCLASEGDSEIEIVQCINGDINGKEEYVEYDDPIDGELLQQAIETKRALFAESYLEANASFADSYVCKDKQIFISAYSPLLILQMTKEQILKLDRDKHVVRIELFINFKLESELSIANAVSRADYVRNINMNKGSGVKIGQIESGVPNINDSDLQNATIIRHTTNNTTTHATRIARILVGESDGLAPEATLYSSGYEENAQSFYSNVEWLISQGVNIINMSAHVIPEDGGSWDGMYNIVAQWVDHLAVQHDIHFVKSSGNTGSLITCPGMAYNAITVGGFNDGNTQRQDDDSRYLYSASMESSSTNRAEKPNIIASAENIMIGTNDTGTSYAAPQVAGVIAQLCSYRSALKTKQATMGAMLAAGALFKLEGVSGSGIRGDLFLSGIRVSGSTQISRFEGAGKLDARCPRSIASSGNYWSPTITTSSFPYTKSVYISTSSNSLIRVAIFWLKRNSITSTPHTPGNLSQTDFTNLDLQVYAPNGTLVGSSSTSYANFEIVQFVPMQTGTYTIKIVRTGNSSSTKEHVGIAIW